MSSKCPQLKDYSWLSLYGDVETFLEKRIEYSGDNPIYIGWNRQANAATDAATWFIVKLTYSGSNPTRIQLPDNGAFFNYAWDSRATYYS